MGFFALIGLSLKNTILLTDYANQARKSGLGAIDSAVAALGERFRPLVATSLTAVVSLIPLAVTSPFWQGLAVVLIFGLLSSTTLVILVFPYYYLGGEFLRTHISRKAFFIWLAITIVLAIALSKINSSLTLLAIPITLLGEGIRTWYLRKA
jgi:Cu/Ag efflux pump CusA